MWLVHSIPRTMKPWIEIFSHLEKDWSCPLEKDSDSVLGRNTTTMVCEREESKLIHLIKILSFFFKSLYFTVVIINIYSLVKINVLEKLVKNFQRKSITETDPILDSKGYNFGSSVVANRQTEEVKKRLCKFKNYIFAFWIETDCGDLELSKPYPLPQPP